MENTFSDKLFELSGYNLEKNILTINLYVIVKGI